MGALATLVRSGKALYAGCPSYTGEQFEAAAAAAADERLGSRSTSPTTTCSAATVEDDLLPAHRSAGTGVIGFCPLASGLLTDKYLDGEVPAGARGAIWPGALGAGPRRRRAARDPAAG